MITTPKEYWDNLVQISRSSDIEPFRVPAGEPLYRVDLNKRLIPNLNVVTVAGDHKAETIFFEVGRYFGHADNVEHCTDLSTTICIIQYVNALNQGGIYVVPCYDTDSQEGKIIFPWRLSGKASAAPGNIQFSIKFFKLNDKDELIFNLNTQPQTYKIVYGMNLDEEIIEDGSQSASTLQTLVQQIKDLEDFIKDNYTVYWVDADKRP